MVVDKNPLALIPCAIAWMPTCGTLLLPAWKIPVSNMINDPDAAALELAVVPAAPRDMVWFPFFVVLTAVIFTISLSVLSFWMIAPLIMLSCGEMLYQPRLTIMLVELATLAICTISTLVSLRTVLPELMLTPPELEPLRWRTTVSVSVDTLVTAMTSYTPEVLVATMMKSPAAMLAADTPPAAQTNDVVAVLLMVVATVVPPDPASDSITARSFAANPEVEFIVNVLWLADEIAAVV